MLKQKESYLGNPNVKRDGVLQQWTPDLLQEYKKCMDNPVYFVENYVKVISLDDGMVPFVLYPYQKDMFKQFQENRFNVVLACRQSGKSISACAYLLWYVLFNPEKTVAILANKGATAREMLNRITLMLENIPFFLQLDQKHSIRDLWNFRITQESLLLLLVVVLFVVCPLISYILTSLLL